MQVELRELYRKGVKRPREEVRQGHFYVGELNILKYAAWYGHEVAPVHADLLPLQLEGLDKVKLLYFRDRNLVLYGDQVVQGMVYEQIWWCKLLAV